MANSIQYGHTASAIQREDGPRFLRITDIQDGRVDWPEVPSCDIPEDEIPKYRLVEGDLVFARTGATTGKSYLIGECPEAVFASYLIRVRVAISLDSKFLAAFFQSPDYWQQIEGGKRGIGQPNVNGKTLGEVTFPLPPMDEQRRIVAEIEKQFTQLEAGVTVLRQVQAKLKRYRAAVLKAACEGRLVPTEAELARQEGRPYEPASELLARILTERRKNWQRRGKYKEPADPDVSDLLPLPPKGWSWASWEMTLAHEEGAFKRGPFGSALTKAIFVESGFKIYEQYCPINDDCSFARYYITPEKFAELQAFEVKAGDYLISCSGVTLGRITRVPNDCERGIINQALLRVRMNEGIISHRYFLHLFRSAFFQKAVFDNSTGSAIPNVKGVKELKAMAIPLPPLAEQTRIVAEVERRLSVVEELETVVAADLRRAARLRQSILHRAFAGRL